VASICDLTLPNVMKCTIVLLSMFTVVADVLIEPGSSDDPGQLCTKPIHVLSLRSHIEGETRPRV